MLTHRKLRIETLEQRNLLAADASGNGVVDAADYVTLRKSQATQAAFADFRSEYGYTKVVGSLFVDGPAYTDVAQGAVNDCAFLATLAEEAYRDPAAIVSMFTINGDGTYRVRFYNGGVAQYVTVDSYLPAGGGQYARVLNGELWVALAEKAYAKEQGAYLNIGYMFAWATLRDVTGQPSTGFNGMSVDAFASAWNAGDLVCFVSPPQSPSVVGNHVYAVVGYDAATQAVTLFNPWGVQYGLTTLSWADVQSNFAYYDRAAA